MIRRIFYSMFLFMLLLSPGSVSAQNSDLRLASIFTPLAAVRASNCSTAVDWQQENLSPLSTEQYSLMERAFVAAQRRDNDTLQQLVLDADLFYELYGLADYLARMAEDPQGIKFMYQRRFDLAIDQHRQLADRFDGFSPDVIVSIVWCIPQSDSQAPQLSGGLIYMSRTAGEWKFHTRQ